MVWIIIYVMQDNKEKKKIVINNVRKSLMPPSSKDFLQTNYLKQSQQLNPNIIHTQNEVAILNDQINYYKQKYDQSLIKIRLLTEKLEKSGGLASFPDSLEQEISATDAKIKKLEQLLHHRRSKQTRKVRAKVLDFFRKFEFEVEEEDLNQIQDQNQMVYFLIDIFSEKCAQFMADRKEMSQALNDVKNSTNNDKLINQNNFLNQKMIDQTQYIRDLQIQIFTLKKDQQASPDSLATATPYFPQSSINPTIFPSASNIKIYESTVKFLQNENKELMEKNSKLESQVKNGEYQIITLKRKIQDYVAAIDKEKNRYRDLEEEIGRVSNQEARWKDRYLMMERQKNQRIAMLENQRRELYPNAHITSHPYDQTIQSNNSPLIDQTDRSSRGEKNGFYINIKKKSTVDPRYRTEDYHHEKESEEEYFDLPQY